MFYRKRKLTSCCVEKNSFDVSKWQPDPVRNPLFSSLKRNPSRPKNFLFSSSSKNPYACPPRKKFFSCVWIPLPKKKIPVCSLCQKILSACFLCQIFLRVLSSQNCFSSYLYGSPLLEYFFSFLEMCVDMSTHQILSTLTFLSKKNKRISRPLCVLCTKWPLPSYFRAYKLPLWCMFKMQPCLPKNWVVRGGDPLRMVRPVEIKIWMSCGHLIVADFLKNHGWCGLIMVPYLLYRLPPLDACCWRSFIAGCAWNLPLWAVRGIFHYSVLDGPSSYG